MPNICLNTLIATGPEDQLTQFQEFARSDEWALNINRFIPMPEDIRNSTAPNRDPKQARRLTQLYGTVVKKDDFGNRVTSNLL